MQLEGLRVATNVIAGMIVPYVVAYSMMWGAIVSWGIMWPLLAKKEGIWFPAGLTDGDFRGLFGYKVSHLLLVFFNPHKTKSCRSGISKSFDWEWSLQIFASCMWWELNELLCLCRISWPLQFLWRMAHTTLQRLASCRYR